MNSFDFFRKRDNRIKPRTPFAALRGVELGLLPLEAYIYKASSVKSLKEDPVDLYELERILAKTDLGLDALLIIIEILERLITDPDSETALFAAESINIIENRYNKQIEKLLADKKNPDNLETLARLTYELGMINRSRKTIKKFYLKESFEYFKQLQEIRNFTKQNVLAITRDVIGLEDYDQALDILSQTDKLIKDDPQVMYLRGEIYYLKKDYKKLSGIIKKLKDLEKSGELDQLPEIRETIEFWGGTGG